MQSVWPAVEPVFGPVDDGVMSLSASWGAAVLPLQLWKRWCLAVDWHQLSSLSVRLLTDQDQLSVWHWWVGLDPSGHALLTSPQPPAAWVSVLVFLSLQGLMWVWDQVGASVESVFVWLGRISCCQSASVSSSWRQVAGALRCEYISLISYFICICVLETVCFSKCDFWVWWNFIT